MEYYIRINVHECDNPEVPQTRAKRSPHSCRGSLNPFSHVKVYTPNGIHYSLDMKVFSRGLRQLTVTVPSGLKEVLL